MDRWDAERAADVEELGADVEDADVVELVESFEPIFMNKLLEISERCEKQNKLREKHRKKTKRKIIGRKIKNAFKTGLTKLMNTLLAGEGCVIIVD